MHLTKIIIGLIGISVVYACPARADWKSGFLQVSCVKELGWFSVRRVEIWNLPSKGPYLTEGLRAGQKAILSTNAQGFFEGDVLQKHPVSCRIAPYNQPGWEGPRNGFEVKVVGHYSNIPTGNGNFDLADYVDVLIDDAPVGRIGLGLQDIGTGVNAISVGNDGVNLVATVCSVVDKDLPDGQTETHCEDRRIQAGAGVDKTESR